MDQALDVIFRSDSKDISTPEKRDLKENISLICDKIKILNPKPFGVFWEWIHPLFPNLAEKSAKHLYVVLSQMFGNLEDDKYQYCGGGMYCDTYRHLPRQGEKPNQGWERLRLVVINGTSGSHGMFWDKARSGFKHFPYYLELDYNYQITYGNKYSCSLNGLYERSYIEVPLSDYQNSYQICDEIEKKYVELGQQPSQALNLPPSDQIQIVTKLTQCNVSAYRAYQILTALASPNWDAIRHFSELSHIWKTKYHPYEVILRDVADQLNISRELPIDYQLLITKLEKILGHTNDTLWDLNNEDNMCEFKIEITQKIADLFVTTCLMDDYGDDIYDTLWDLINTLPLISIK